MRELKFRAWDKATKRYWNVAGLSFEKGRLVEVYLENYPTSFEGNEDCKKPDEVILEQYTGEFDINDKEIAEGDIVEYFSANDEDIVRAVVNYGYPFGYDNDDGTLFVKGFFYDDCKIFDLRDLDEEQYEDLCSTRIIGNIHENPELLEGEK